MLLRSITKHVKDQNWFAVALDFFIVVAGILIAFQITEWNETRQSYAVEQALIENLSTEFAILEGVLEQRLERAESLVSNTANLINLIRVAEEPNDRQAVKSLLMSTSRYSASVAVPTSFQMPYNLDA